jgi:hypothetical protein
MGESWAIGSMDPEVDLPSDEWPRLHWKKEVGDLEAAKELGWKKHGYPEGSEE